MTIRIYEEALAVSRAGVRFNIGAAKCAIEVDRRVLQRGYHPQRFVLKFDCAYDKHDHGTMFLLTANRMGDKLMSLDLDTFCRTLVSGTSDAITFADSGGMIRLWNRGAERIFGFNESEALGQSLDLIIPEALRNRHWDGYAQTIRTGVTRYGAGDVLAVPAIRKDGQRISVEFTILPFRDQDGRMSGIAAILRDVSKRFEELKTLRTRLAAAGGH